MPSAGSISLTTPLRLTAPRRPWHLRHHTHLSIAYLPTRSEADDPAVRCVQEEVAGGGAGCRADHGHYAGTRGNAIPSGGGEFPGPGNVAEERFRSALGEPVDDESRGHGF